MSARLHADMILIRQVADVTGPVAHEMAAFAPTAAAVAAASRKRTKTAATLKTATTG